MKISSAAFPDGGMMPKKCTGFGEDLSPEFTIADTPEKTACLAIIMDDLDVPFRKSFNHWIIWNIPKTEVIPEGLPHGAILEKPFPARQGIAWGKHRYRGPKQPFFIRGEHRYVFTVYALDCELTLTENTDRDGLLLAMEGHILAKAELMGRYGRGKGK